MMSELKPDQTGDERYLQRFIASLGVFMILISQLLIFSKQTPEQVLFPPYLWMSILGLAIFISSRLVKPTPAWKRISLRLAPSRRAFWILLASALSILTAVSTYAFMSFNRLNYIPILTIWFLAAGCYIYAFSDGIRIEQGILARIAAQRNELLAVALVTVCGAVLRLYRLGTLPRILDGDEGLIGLNALGTTVGRLANPFALWENIGAIYLQAINVMFKIFGVSSFSLRLLPAIGGILAIPSLYLLARQIGGRKIALMAAILLAASHAHIHFSRIVSVAYIQGTWFVPLELYFLLSGLERRNPWRAAVAGALLGVHFTIYLTAQVIVGVLLVYSLIALLALSKWTRPARGALLAFWGGYLIMVLPQLTFIAKFPGEFLARLASEGTFQSGWLADTMDLTGKSSAAILFERVLHSFLSLIYYPAVDFYGSPLPNLSVIASALFLLGMVIALVRTREPAFLLLNGYFWGATIALGLFAIPPSSDTYRILMAVPPALVMAAMGLEEVLGLFYLRWDKSRIAYLVGTGGILLGIIFFDMWAYFGDFVGQCRFGGGPVSRFASYLGDTAGNAGADVRIYLLSDEIYFYGSHASTDFLSWSHTIQNHAGPIDELAIVPGDWIVASPGRIDELEAWARDHPGGELHSEYDCRTRLILTYQIPNP